MLEFGLWGLSAYCGVRFLSSESGRFFRFIHRLEGKILTEDLRKGSDLFLELREKIQTGQWIDDSFWDRFSTLGEPFGHTLPSQIQKLRADGVSVIPTIDRILKWAADQLEIFELSQAAVATARGQALIGGTLVPLFGISFYTFVEEIHGYQMEWILVNGFAFVVAFSAGVWVMLMASSARFGGLPDRMRASIWVIPLCLEWFLAQLNGGISVEAAWVTARRFAMDRIPDLHQYWISPLPEVGENLPVASPPRFQNRIKKWITRPDSKLLVAISNLNTQVEKALLMSLMEGTPITERIYLCRDQMQTHFIAAIKTELNLLNLRTLKPLFFLLFPALFFLLIFGLIFAFYDGLKAGW